MRKEDVEALKVDIRICKLIALVAGSDHPPDGDGLPETDEIDDTAPPRKRPRLRSSSAHDPPAFRKTLRETLTCEVCFFLYYEPMTLRCGHVGDPTLGYNPSSTLTHTFCS